MLKLDKKQRRREKAYRREAASLKNHKLRTLAHELLKRIDELKRGHSEFEYTEAVHVVRDLLMNNKLVTTRFDERVLKQYELGVRDGSYIAKPKMGYPYNPHFEAQQIHILKNKLEEFVNGNRHGTEEGLQTQSRSGHTASQVD